MQDQGEGGGRKGGGIEEEEEIPDQKKLEGRKKQLVNEIRKLESFQNMDEEEYNKIQKKSGRTLKRKESRFCQSMGGCSSCPNVQCKKEKFDRRNMVSKSEEVLKSCGERWRVLETESERCFRARLNTRRSSTRLQVNEGR